MAKRTPLVRALALVVVVWIAGVTGGRDLLHNHSGLSDRPDCPACRLERAAGVTTPTAAALIATFALTPVGIVVDQLAPGFTSAGSSLEPPPRSPPLPA